MQEDRKRGPPSAAWDVILLPDNLISDVGAGAPPTGLATAPRDGRRPLRYLPISPVVRVHARVPGGNTAPSFPGRPDGFEPEPRRHRPPLCRLAGLQVPSPSRSLLPALLEDGHD